VNAGEGPDFAQSLYDRLLSEEEILKEFLYYIVTGTFACKVKIQGYTVIDVLVWQMDHFKAKMDTDTTDTRQNPEKMVLLAFHTFLDMKKNPELYIGKMQSETGTDYEGKYQ
jgi:hypothetical protein